MFGLSTHIFWLDIYIWAQHKYARPNARHSLVSNTFNSESSRKVRAAISLANKGLRRELAGLTLGHKTSNQILDGRGAIDGDNEWCPEGLLIVSCTSSGSTYLW